MCLLLVGCSAVFMETDRNWTPASQRAPRCTETKGFAAWDAASGVVWVILGLGAYANLDTYEDPRLAGANTQNDTATVLTAAGVIGAVVSFASAASGFSKSNECALQRDEYDRTLRP